MLLLTSKNKRGMGSESYYGKLLFIIKGELALTGRLPFGVTNNEKTHYDYDEGI